MLTQVNGTGVGGESLETINHFLLDLEQESLANGGSEPVTMTFKRRAAGIHAATARRLAADATNALANVAAKSGGAIISGGKGVVKGFKKVLSSHSGVNADVVDVLEEEADKYGLAYTRSALWVVSVWTYTLPTRTVSGGEHQRNITHSGFPGIKITF
jgi:hypothetical protein